MKKRVPFHWLITEDKKFIIVHLNDSVNCMLSKINSEKLNEMKENVLAEINFWKGTHQTTVTNVELLQ